MISLPRGMEVTFDDRVECATAAILHVLKWYGVEHPELVFGCAPGFEFDPAEGLIQFWPPGWAPLARERYGLCFEEKNFTGFEAGWEEVLGRLSAGHPTVVVTDAYHLPFYSAYHTNHTGHCLIVTGYDPAARRVEVADISAMLWKGFIDLDQMRLALNLELLPRGQVELRYFDIRPPRTDPAYNKGDLLGVVLPRALGSLKGDVPGIPPHCLTGSKATGAYASFLPQLMERCQEDPRGGAAAVLANRFAGLNVAERRMWFSEILRKAGELLGLDELKAMAELWVELHEEWRVVFNMHLKALAAGPAALTPRILKRLEGAARLEAQAVERLEEALP
ncbi:MAG: BtrH N-terminal domain-containing protein [Acetobacteraceae bacterium]|nr:BtrH N-terminal domain-containing protein [Acetobacteraceae bacterium]